METFTPGLLEGKTAFIAGGSSGINLGIAHGLAEAGARISIISRKIDKVEAAVAELKAAGARGDGRGGRRARLCRGRGDAARDARRLGRRSTSSSRARPAISSRRRSACRANAFKTVVDIDLIGTFNVLRAAYEFLRKPGASLISITAGQAVNATAVPEPCLRGQGRDQHADQVPGDGMGAGAACASTRSRRGRSPTPRAWRG